MNIRAVLSIFCLGTAALFLAVGLTQPVYGQEAEAPKPAAALSDDEVLAKVTESPVDRQLEFLGTYERLGKKQMARRIADEILKKDPTNAEALRVKEGKPMVNIDPTSVGGAASPPSEEDIFSDRVASLTRRGAYSQLARELASRKRGYRGTAFPYQEDLADAYQKIGNKSAARAAYRELANGRGYPASQRSSARRALADFEKDDMFNAATAALRRKDTDEAMRLVEKILAKYPSDSDAKVMKAITLSESGDTSGALVIMEELQSKYRGKKFPYDVDLAGIHLAAQDYDAAEAIYKRIGGKAGAGGLREIDKARKVEAAYTAIQRGRAEGAVSIADELLAEWPKDPYVQVLRGEALLAAGRPGEAIAELGAAKDAHFKDTSFPAQSDLALAYHRTNDLAAADAAYSEVLSGDYTPAEREDAVIQTRELRRELGAELSTDLQMISEEEGDVKRASVYGHTGLQDGWRFWGWGHVDTVELKDSALNIKDAERFEGGIAIERRGSNFNSSLRLGGSEDDIIVGGRISRPYGKIGSWYLEGAFNERADDSISVEALDGRQHRLEVGMFAQVMPRLYLDTSAYLRQVELFDDSLGEGWGWMANLDYTIRDADGRKPALRIGYAGEVHVFDGGSVGGALDGFLTPGLTAAERSELVGDFVEEEINLHGIRGQIEGRISESTSYYLSGALQYDFFDKEFQYSAGAGIEHFFSEKLKIVLGVEYYSAGQGASTSEGVTVGNVGVSILF